MKRSTIVLSAVIAFLVASNLWWLYASVDCGVTQTYRDVSFRDNEIALRQMLAILPIVAAEPRDRIKIVAAATRSADHPDAFEKDGYLWVGRLGLKFDVDGRLLEATTNPR